MKKYLPVLFLSCFFSVKSYTQSTTVSSNDSNHNTISVDKDAMNWKLSYDFMGIDMGARQATCTGDMIPPDILCPTNRYVQGTSTNSCGANVDYPIPIAYDNCQGTMTTQCNPPWGFFAPGTTTVSCTATDASNNTAICTFEVFVTDGCSNCPQIIIINDATANGLYHAEYSVSATNTFTSGTNTNFKAGNIIKLNNEFTVPANTNFSAEIEDCTTNFGTDGDQN